MPETLSKSPNFRSYRIAFAAIALGILAVPLVAMQMSSEVNWQLGDFLVFAAMLAALGTGIELALRYAGGKWARMAIIAACIFGFLLVWALLATG